MLLAIDERLNAASAIVPLWSFVDQSHFTRNVNMLLIATPTSYPFSLVGRLRIEILRNFCRDDGRRLNHLSLQPNTLRARGQGQQLWLGICTKEVRAQSLILARQFEPSIDPFFASSQIPRNMGLQETASRILVIGTTGSGKSTFINLVSGSTLSVSDGLKSCTSEVLESRPFSLDDQSIILIDTPGFDDTTRVDTDIITTISTYLANMYKEGVKLSGVIYMHRISDVRMGGTSLLSFRIFRELCGDESLHNALIVTTMWSLVDPELGESREEELATTDDLFKPALDHGAQLVRHDGTLESAQNILRRIITNKGTALRIQRELVDEGRVLSDTSAGAELVCHFAEQAGRLEARSKKLHKQMNDPLLAQDEEGRTMLQLELDEMRRGERRIEDEIERLRKMTSESAIDPHSDWVPIESVEHPLGNLQVELPTKEQVRTALQQQFSRLQERLQNEAYPAPIPPYFQSRSRELEDEQKRAEYHARRVAEETQEMRRRNDAMVERQNEVMHMFQEEERRQERSEVPYLILCGAVILKVFEFIAYTVF